jgi:hypothetical protein
MQTRKALAARLLTKPYRRDAFARATREALDS